MFDSLLGVPPYLVCITTEQETLKLNNTIMRRIRDAFNRVLFVVVLAAFTACSTNSTNDGLTEEEVIIASEIIGQSLSDNNDGLLSSMYDANASFTTERMGFASSNQVKTGDVDQIMQDDDRTGRGIERNFSHSYDPETGIHTITMERSIERPNFSRSMSADLEYILTDTAGNFIARPRANRDLINTRDYSGVRSGSMENPRISNSYHRENDLFYEGLISNSSTLRINGTHKGRGNAEFKNRIGQANDRVDRPDSRSYVLQLELIDLEIDKALLEANQNLEEGVFGTATYTLELTEDGETKNLEGTIEMDGDGSALLELPGVERLLQIDLRSGDVKNGRPGFGSGGVQKSGPNF